MTRHSCFTPVSGPFFYRYEISVPTIAITIERMTAWQNLQGASLLIAPGHHLWFCHRPYQSGQQMAKPPMLAAFNVLYIGQERALA
ncbi:MAG: hypothetical protein AAFX01_10665 [Cyanobacteria bacterium J06638_28]